MKLIVGLGNPGEKYKNSRHNAGYMVVDGIQKSKFKSQNYNSKVKTVKTNTFMNESGEAVRRFTSIYSLEPSNLYIVFDDLDLKLGEYKIQKGKGPHDHNGVNSIYDELGTKDFWHVRVGVDNRDPENRTEGEEYVLQNFAKDEEIVLKSVIDKVVKDLSNIN